jgi:nitrite reductase (NADH) large subunit
MAACRTVEELLLRAPDRYAIEIFGAEPEVNYNRVLLSLLLAGERRFEDIILNGRDWYEQKGIRCHRGVTIETIDRAARCVIDGKGARHVYDRLLIATGSDPLRLTIPGANLDGVITFRDIADVRRMRKAARTLRHAVVIGGGLLGLEAANGLNRLGMNVTVVHLMPTLMERQLDAASGALLERDLRRRGMEILTAATTSAILGSHRPSAVRLADGRELRADLVVMAAGIRPNVALARKAGLACTRGIEVDDHMVTSDSCILAVGECVEHRGKTYGLVAPIFDMCKSAADRLAGVEGAGFGGAVPFASLKVTGIDVFSAGDLAALEDDEDVVFRDTARAAYRRLVMRRGRLASAILYGDVSDSGFYLDLIQSKARVERIFDRLIFGRFAVERMKGSGGPAAREALAAPAPHLSQSREPCPAP